ncbi:MAG: FprA family A-type flavoprotein [Coriobacteriales bacterium]|nr:FprA family A-type flavoprotein [Coriobacteriales bacterium]
MHKEQAHKEPRQETPPQKEQVELRQVAPDILITSVLNPSMRVFDIEMRTGYGTSYNSYAVIGSQKTALIDACHASFARDWLEKIDAALGGMPPDYLVMNHTEPDHSGAVSALLERWPQIPIIVSAPGAMNLKHITNREDLNLQMIKTTSHLDLGDISLHFILAPFLHWPDTMFTWLPERKVLFSGDFLGAHFCEPRLFDTQVLYRRDYIHEMESYFNSIMGPFKSYVLQGLDKLADINANFICPSHGPIVTKGCELENSLVRYRQWATPRPAQPTRIALFYCSAYGNTARLAEHIVQGVTEILPAAHISSHNLVLNEPGDLHEALNNSDALLIGSPTINRDALPVVWNLLAEIDAINIVKRPVALFGTYGWSGEAVPHLAARLQNLRARVFEPQLRVRFVPRATDLEAAKGFGRNFARQTFLPQEGDV